MKNTLSVMDPHLGDLKITWDPDNEDEVELAEAQFEKSQKKGMQAYAVDKKGERAKLITKFDPKLRAIIMAPFVAGG